MRRDEDIPPATVAGMPATAGRILRFARGNENQIVFMGHIDIIDTLAEDGLRACD